MTACSSYQEPRCQLANSGHRSPAHRPATRLRTTITYVHKLAYFFDKQVLLIICFSLFALLSSWRSGSLVSAGAGRAPTAGWRGQRACLLRGGGDLRGTLLDKLSAMAPCALRLYARGVHGAHIRASIDTHGHPRGPYDLERILFRMKSLRGGVLVALVLISALVVIASPAFATPNLTSSTGTLPVSPFLTPTSASTSSSTFRGVSTSLAIPALGLAVTCRQSWGSGYVDAATHTNFRITSLSFNGCTVDGGLGTVDNNGTITCDASTRVPWLLTAKTVDAARRSASGGISIPGGSTGCRFRVTSATFGSISFLIDPGQSCLPAARGTPNVYTWAARPAALQVTCAIRVTTTGGLIFTGTGNYGAVAPYTVRPDTARDAVISVTAVS